jgi:hypothetical protein
MRPLRPARIAFVTALVAGVAMIAASVHGMLGIDRQLEQRAGGPARPATYRVLHVRDTYCPHRARRV